jgi:hypothetical protein
VLFNQVFYCSDDCTNDSEVIHRWICVPFARIEALLEKEESDDELVHQVRFVLRYMGEYVYEAVAKSDCKVPA